MSKSNFLIQSGEFVTFSTMRGDLTGYFNNITRDRPGDTLAKYRKALNLDERWTLALIVDAGNMISEFKGSI